jgi:hypothetical protein
MLLRAAAIQVSRVRRKRKAGRPIVRSNALGGLDAANSTGSRRSSRLRLYRSLTMNSVVHGKLLRCPGVAVGCSPCVMPGRLWSIDGRTWTCPLAPPAWDFTFTCPRASAVGRAPVRRRRRLRPATAPFFGPKPDRGVDRGFEVVRCGCGRARPGRAARIFLYFSP